MSWSPLRLFNTKPPEQVVPAPVDLPLITHIKNDIKDFYLNPENQIKNEPLKALAYLVGTTVLGLFTALVFPFFGYFSIGLAFGIIGRAISLNFAEYGANLLTDIFAQFSSIFQTLSQHH